jgi:hypothetical protein
MDRLNPGEELGVNGILTSSNQRVRLILQGDGNVVLYRNGDGKALWATNTDGKPVTRAVMQHDGNFVLYDASGKARWASNRDGNPGAFLVVQDDGNLVSYRGGQAIWASNTVQNWDPSRVDTGNVRLARGKWMSTTASRSESGLISLTTRWWSTDELVGFTASACPVLLDSGGNALWPADVNSVKKQRGVDGILIIGKKHDRVEHWSVQLPPELATVGQLGVLQFYDPKNRLAEIFKNLPQTVADIMKVLKEVQEAIAVLSL